MTSPQSHESADVPYTLPCGNHVVVQTSSHGPLCSCCSGSGVVTVRLTDAMVEAASVVVQDEARSG